METASDWLSIGVDREKESSPLNGVSKSANGRWSAWLTINDTVHNFGEYKTMKQAILAHDMEALRLFGLESGSYLNQIYELCPSKEKCQGQVMRFQVKSADGLQFTVDHEYENSKCSSCKYVPPRIVYPLKTEAEMFSNGIGALPMVYGTVPIPRSDYGRKWTERISNSHAITSLFTFEVQMNPLTPELRSRLSPLHEGDTPSAVVKTVFETFGILLDLFTVPYLRTAQGPRFAHCAAVVDAGLLFPFVEPGDILLCCGDTPLVYGLPGSGEPNPAAVQDSESSSDAAAAPVSTTQVESPPNHLELICNTVLKSATPSTNLCTLRFLRRAGLSPNSLISPAELSLLLKEVPVSARLSTVPTPGVQELGTGPLKLHLVFIESTVPMVARKMLSGQGIQWDSNQTASAPPPPQQPLSLLHSPTSARDSTAQSQSQMQQTNQSQAAALFSLSLIPESVAPRVSRMAQQARSAVEKGPGKMGVYRDKNRWVSVVSLPSALPISTSAELHQHPHSARMENINSALETVSTGNDGTKLFFVGRHDTEEEAQSALKRARRELAVTGTHVYRRPPTTISSFVQNFNAGANASTGYGASAMQYKYTTAPSMGTAPANQYSSSSGFVPSSYSSQQQSAPQGLSSQQSTYQQRYTAPTGTSGGYVPAAASGINPTMQKQATQPPPYQAKKL